MTQESMARENMETEIADYLLHLQEEERSAATIEKYRQELKRFAVAMDGRAPDKAMVLRYKAALIERYAPASVNTMLAALNGFFAWTGQYDCRVKLVRVQRQAFAARDRELTREEYFRLLRTAQKKRNRRLYYLLETICATGIRVSELQFITVAAVRRGRAAVNCKGKCRVVLLPRKLCAELGRYIKERGITQGSIFTTRGGKQLDRSNIWSEMKALCAAAGVAAKKVFPHNLRHLFARTYYKLEKNLDALASILGHSSINTTRIYTQTTTAGPARQIERLNLLC